MPNLFYLGGQKGGLNSIGAQVPLQQLQQMQMMGLNPSMISGGVPMMGLGNNGMQAVMLPMQAPQLGDKNQANLPMGIQMMGLPGGIQGIQGMQGIQGLQGMQGIQGLQGLQGFPQGMGFQVPQNFLGEKTTAEKPK